MHDASTTSPFINFNPQDDWVTWTEQSSLMSLIDEEQTDRRYVFDSSQPCSSAPEMPEPLPQPVVINRPQYNAILNRINQAKQNTGAYTSWNVP